MPRHEMHGVVYAHIEMQQPIKAFQQIVDICEAGHTPVPRISRLRNAWLGRYGET